MKILHTADLHLDSAFAAFGAMEAEEMRESGRELLKNIFECAKREDCRLMLVAGDMFDSKFVSPETKELLISLIEENGIYVVVSPGNHDHYTESSFYAYLKKRLEGRIFVFDSPVLRYFDIDELRVRVFGFAFITPTITESPLVSAPIPEDNGYLRLFCGHGDTSSPVSRYCPLCVSDLERFGFAYSALGHVHNCKDSEDTDGRVRYSGFAEGRAFDEYGEGGVYVIDVDENKCEAKKIVLSQRSFYDCELELSADAASALDAAVGYIKEKSLPDGAYLRLTLTGNAEPAQISALKAQTESVAESEGLEYFEIIDATLPFLDGAYLAKDPTVRGEVYRTLLPRLTSPDAEVRARAVRALKIALLVLDGKSVTDGGRK